MKKLLLSEFINSDKALSIQCTLAKFSRTRFQKENEVGIDISASNRNYRDANHKPELVYALKNYQEMNGFRAFKEIIKLF